MRREPDGSGARALTDKVSTLAFENFSPPSHDDRTRTMTPAHNPQNADGARDFVKQSSLYQEFLAEREEILKHKWIESERLGYDIGFERALLDWIRKHRDSWRAARRGQPGIGARTQSAFQSGSGRASTLASPSSAKSTSSAPRSSLDENSRS